ncbi:MAG: DUF1501 domain-containing protein [Gemmataceae bacterium]
MKHWNGNQSHQPPVAWSFLNRRDVLRVGSLSVAGALLPFREPQTAAAPRPGRARSVIVLWLAGGVTHIDSFDPKPDAPAEIRGTLSALETTVPGIRFCETMPRLAEQARHLAVIRSFSHDSNDHFLSQARALSGRRVSPAQITTEPNIGALVYRVLGGRGGLPGYIAVPGRRPSRLPHDAPPRSHRCRRHHLPGPWHRSRNDSVRPPEPPVPRMARRRTHLRRAGLEPFAGGKARASHSLISNGKRGALALR